jgi:hypothetical protein
MRDARAGQNGQGDGEDDTDCTRTPNAVTQLFLLPSGDARGRMMYDNLTRSI